MSNFSDTTIITMSDQENEVVLCKPDISWVMEGWKKDKDKDTGDFKGVLYFHVGRYSDIVQGVPKKYRL